MDEITLYRKHYKSISIKAKHFIITIFKMHSSDKRPFNYFYSQIIEKINEYHDVNYSKLYNARYLKAFQLFVWRRKHYEGDDDEIIKLILKNDIAQLFENLPSIKYESFIIAMARKEALNSLSIHLSNFYDYYKLAYETKSFQYIYLSDFDNLHFEDSDEYKEMVRINNPDKKNIDIPVSNILNKNTDTSKGNKLSKEFENEVVEKLKSFSDEERFVLMRLIYNNYIVQKKRSINFIDFIRICKIIGGYEDLRIFLDEKPLGNNSAYQKISKSLNNIPSNSRVETFKSILNKIDFIKSSQINSILKIEKNKKS